MIRIRNIVAVLSIVILSPIALLAQDKLGCELKLNVLRRQSVRLRTETDGRSYDSLNRGFPVTISEWLDFTRSQEEKYKRSFPAEEKRRITLNKPVLPSRAIPGLETITVSLRGYLKKVTYYRASTKAFKLDVFDGFTSEPLAVHIPPGEEYCNARRTISELIEKDGGKDVFEPMTPYAFIFPPLVVVTGYVFADEVSEKVNSSDRYQLRSERYSSRSTTKTRVVRTWELYPVLSVREEFEPGRSVEQVDWRDVGPVLDSISNSNRQLKETLGVKDKEADDLIIGITINTEVLRQKWQTTNSTFFPKVYFDSLASVAFALKRLIQNTKIGENTLKRYSSLYRVSSATSYFQGKRNRVKKPTNNPRPEAPNNKIRTLPSSASREANVSKSTAMLRNVDSDLQIKVAHALISNRSWSNVINVIVNTIAETRPISGLEVYAVPLFYEDDTVKWERFSRASTPTNKPLSPGLYKIGTEIGKGTVLKIGGNGETHQEVDIVVPR